MRLRHSIAVAGTVGCLSLGTLGCGASGQNTQAPPPPADGKVREYRAVCQEKEAHGGNEQVLSRWLMERDKAVALGQYHGDFKEKGHRWRIEERVKPETGRAGSPGST
jgi:hypothetical protein